MQAAEALPTATFPPLRRRLRMLAPWLMLAPCLLFLAAFIYWPVVYSLWLSLHDVNLLSGRMRFVGLENYVALAGGRDFRNALWITCVFVLVSVPARLLLALMLAQLLVAETRRVRILRGAFFMPYVASTSAIAVVWSWMLQTDAGLVNAFIGFFGAGKVNWLYDADTALFAVAMVNAWKQLGYDMVLFVAGLQAINPAIYEAARIDGASPRRQFLDITLPLLTPTLLFLLVISVIDTFQVFTLVNVMTGGGPALSTEVIVSFFYRMGFIRLDYGTASAVVVILFVVLLALTAVKLGVFGKRVTYDLG